MFDKSVFFLNKLITLHVLCLIKALSVYVDPVVNM